jgi:hypothetical protein
VTFDVLTTTNVKTYTLPLQWKQQVTLKRRYISFFFYFLWLCSPARDMASSSTRFLDHTRLATVGKTPLDEWSARRRDLYLTTHTTNFQAPDGIWTHDRSRRAAVDLRLRTRGRWETSVHIYQNARHRNWEFNSGSHTFNTSQTYLRRYGTHNINCLQRNIYIFREYQLSCEY